MQEGRLRLDSVPSMVAYIVRTPTKISPFDEPVSKAQIGLSSLEDAQRAVLEEAGLVVERVDALPGDLKTPCVVIFDYVFVSYMMLEQFLARAYAGGENAVLAFPSEGLSSLASGMMGVDSEDHDGQSTLVFDLFYLAKPPSSALDGAKVLASGSKRIVVPRREGRLALKMPRLSADSNVLDVPLTARVVAHVKHWVHVLRLNQLLIGVMFFDNIRRHRARSRWALLKAVLGCIFFDRKLSRPAFVDRFVTNLNVIGKNVEIHPSARISGSFIGDGAKIGPGVRIRHSLIGDRTEVTEDCSINYSVLGADCLVLRDTYMTACVSYPESTLSNYKVQTSLFGRGVFLTASAALIDAKFNGNVMVEHQGELFDAGTPFLGVCLGHRVMVGAHVTIQSGRAIPNGYQIVTPPEQVLSKVPVDLSTSAPLIVRKGTLEPSS